MMTLPFAAAPVLAVVEDMAPLRENLIVSLKALGFDVWGCESAEVFYREAITRPVNIVLIDLGLPGEDGIEAISHLRKNRSLGVIIITADGSMEKRLIGMAVGADHYFVKPVKLPELFSAIDSLWRRISSGNIQQPKDQPSPPWQLNTLTRMLTPPGGKPEHLTPSEAALLSELSKLTGQIVSRAELCEILFSEDASSDPHRLEVLISRMRKKFRDGGILLPLRSVFGKGITFSAPIKIE